MFNVCYRCGVYRADKQIDPTGPVAICPECGHHHPFRRLPLITIGGASGTGKSALLQVLAGSVTHAVCLDTDILWRPEFNRPEQGYRDFFETWLRLAKNIAQAERPAALFGAGFAVPANLEACVERRYFGALHILALVCDDDELAGRLKARPAWRGCTPEFIAAQVSFNHWLREQGQQPARLMTLLDTTHVSVEEAAATVSCWLADCIREQDGGARSTTAI